MLLTRAELAIIVSVFARLADDIHEGDPADYECSEREARAICHKALDSWRAIATESVACTISDKAIDSLRAIGTPTAERSAAGPKRDYRRR